MLILMFAVPLQAQDTGGFQMDAIVVRGDRESRDARVDIYVSIPFNRLTFLSTSGGFASEYEVAANAYRSDDRNRRRGLAQSRTWKERAETNLFAHTRSEALHHTASNALDLPPGRYLLEVRVRDVVSGEVYTRDRPIVVRNLARSTALSDLVLLDDYDSTDNSITPRIGGVVGTEDHGFKLFYEIYTDVERDVMISKQVRRLSKGSQGFMKSIFGIGKNDDEDAGDVTFQREDLRRLRPGRNPSIVDIPMSDLRAGEYLVKVQVHDEAGLPIDEAERTVSVRWSGLDDHIRDLNQAIAQLQYIAKKDELEYIQSAETRSERLSRFQEFWDKRDPTPGTPRNERMEEYYYRVDFANRRFTHMRDGWKTDRGHVIVLFGAPDFVENPLGSSVRPYEVWYYYRIGRRFVFLDRNGMGDFELMVPIWDEKTRIR